MIPEFVNCVKCNLTMGFMKEACAYTDFLDNDHIVCSGCWKKIKDKIEKLERNFFGLEDKK